ncbi:MAG: NAD(P)/FAD-dependent oxidoreductase [Hyphomonadaceae bacterium]|nr:NAD(P)/FAD-dependent oxidoreductase [Hyphomonadaceae bacterium]
MPVTRRARPRPNSRPRLVVIGNGMAGCRAVEEILALASDRFAITIIGAERQVNYNRIMLSPLLAGDKTFDEIVLNDASWYADNGIELITGCAASAVDRDARRVELEDGRVLPYDALILATGSNPLMLPIPGMDLPGVVTFRNVDDVETMLAACGKGGRAAVIGGGLLGLEAAAGLARNGMDVTVVHLMPILMERQLDQSASYLMVRELERRGIAVLLEAKTAAFEGRERVEAVRFDDGGVTPADLVVVAAGIRPNADLARECGLDVKRGVVVDDALRTSDPSIYAVGECVEHAGLCYGLVAPIWNQCRALASTLASDGALAFKGGETGTKLKVSGVEVYSAGLFAGHDRQEDVVFRDAARGVYKRLVFDNERLVGAVLFGDADDGPWYLSLIQSGASVIDQRETLIFGRAVTEALAGANPRSAVAGWPDTAEICGCNGVCKGAITNAITANGLSTLDDVRAVTKASASCGSCTPLVEALLASMLGEGYEAGPAVKTVCRCTPYGHSLVREQIIARRLTSIPAIMQELEWTTPDGCASCRPALNYYLLCAWPGEYEDDKHSRFINERAHGNIQKNGTFSVVPRMWGGLTSPAELRAIADVADKFKIPTVKVTGGQRIDLLGVKKEDLPAVWADLGAAGMVSGHAYGKALRTVKTCVGTDWCRFGTQDSTGLGVRIEKFMWGSWTPAKVKLAVSGCPRNCAEATCKDIGVICVDSGYEIHLGGAAGLHIKGTEILCKVATEDEALEVIVATTQLYREDAHYLERIYKWMARVGLECIRLRVIEDAAQRLALFERFVRAQTYSQIDPWAERARGVDSDEFRPLTPALTEAAE